MKSASLMTVVETAPYLADAAQVMDEAERIELVNMIAADPQVGDAIPGTGCFGKVRIPLKGRGKPGGGRLIAFFHDVDMPVFLIAVYAKNVQGDLDSRQRKAATALTTAIRARFGR